ncbi:MAG: glycosyltransferase [Bifidobacterium sp.]|uniref:Glycosyltransferase n=1 Tax=Bifidobacterium fermentum TaxID=3059035 RepID=A0AB39UI81_9BIFI
MTRILAFGTYNKRKHPRVGIIIDGLRQHGCEVREINHPLTLSTAGRVELLKKPWKLLGFAADVMGLWIRLRRDAKRWIRDNGRPDAVLVGYMGHFDVLLAHHLFHGIPILLDHLIFAGDTARDRGASGLKVKLLRHLDRMAIDASSLVLLDTEEHKAMLRPGDHGIVVPVGASEEWYEARSNAHKRDKGIIFYGLYTPLQGTPVIAEAIRLLAKRGVTPHVTLVGQGQDYDAVHSRLERLENVEFIDWVEPEDLPRLVAEYCIALGIFSTTPKGLHVVPNKVYQSMAAGCAVITSDTAPQRRELGDSALFTQPGSSEALSEAILQLLENPSKLEGLMKDAERSSQRFTAFEITRPIVRWLQARHEFAVIHTSRITDQREGR